MKISDSNGGVNHIVPFSNGCLSPEHVAKIGPAFPLFLLLEDMVTTGKGTDGHVHGLKPVKDEEMALRLGIPARTVRDHRRRLAEHRYIACIRTAYGYRLTVRKSKKWAVIQLGDRRKNVTLPAGDRQKTVAESDRKASERPTENRHSNKTKATGTVSGTPSSAAAWQVIGIDPTLNRKFAVHWEACFEGRNGDSLEVTMKLCADSWEASGGKVPGPFFGALARIRQAGRATDAPSAPSVRTIPAEEIPA
jgi:ribosomal protein L18